MSNRVMLGLGDFRFAVSVAAYQKLEREHSFRWQKQDRIGRLPAMQYVGPDLPSVSLNGVIYPAFRGGLGQIELMRAMATLGQPLDLVAGTGVILGLWVILEIKDSHMYFTDDGRPRRVDFALKLREYGEDAAGPANAGNGTD